MENFDPNTTQIRDFRPQIHALMRDYENRFPFH